MSQNKYEVHPHEIKRMPRLALIALDLFMFKDERETVVIKVRYTLLNAVQGVLWIQKKTLLPNECRNEEVYKANKAWMDKMVEDAVLAAEESLQINGFANA